MHITMCQANVRRQESYKSLPAEFSLRISPNSWCCKLRCRIRGRLWEEWKSILLSVAACDEEWRRVAAAAAETQRLLPGLATPMRTPSAPLGTPLILSPRISVPTTAASLLNGSGPPGSLLSAGDPHGLIYTPYADYANYAALASPLLTEYATADHSGGLFAR